MDTVSTKYGVAIICMAYNHEKFIRETLEGFINQQTTFPFVAYVHDDASTDNTADIIRSYEELYPNIIRGIYQKENQYSMKIGIVATYIEPLINSEYVAYCEGDDFWSDPMKLQRQYEAMNRSPQCILCVHKAEEIKSTGEKTGIMYPKFDYQDGLIQSDEFIKMCEVYSFQTASYFVRTNAWREYIKNPPEFRRGSDVGDECMLLYYGNLGPVYYVNALMSCYRRGVASSWSMQIGNPANTEKYILHHEKMVNMLQKYDVYTNKRYSSSIKKRISKHLFCVLTLSNRLRDFLKKENRKYLKEYSLKKRIFIVMGMLFPEYAKKRYYEKLINAHGSRVV